MTPSDTATSEGATGRTVQHEWRGGGWRHHVVRWSGGVIDGKRVGMRSCSEPRCEINFEPSALRESLR